MKDFKPSPFDNFQKPNFGRIAAIGLFLLLEIIMFTMFFSIYTETIGLMSNNLLSELPIIGQVFAAIDPDASASHIISILLAVFSVGTPIFIWSSVYSERIMDNPREWFEHPQNKIIACLTGVIMLLVVALECTSLYTLIAREITPSGFVTQEETSGLMQFLAANKGFGIGVSIVIAIINIVLGLFTTRAFRALKSQEQ